MGGSIREKEENTEDKRKADSKTNVRFESASCLF